MHRGLAQSLGSSGSDQLAKKYTALAATCAFPEAPPTSTTDPSVLIYARRTATLDDETRLQGRSVGAAGRSASGRFRMIVLDDPETVAAAVKLIWQRLP